MSVNKYYWVFLSFYIALSNNYHLFIVSGVVKLPIAYVPYIGFIKFGASTSGWQ